MVPVRVQSGMQENEVDSERGKIKVMVVERKGEAPQEDAEMNEEI